MRPAAWRRLVARTVLVAFTTVGCGGSGDDRSSTTTTAAVESTPTTAGAPAFPPPTAPPVTLPQPEQLGKQQLRELVAPVALYPDVVLASLLPATTNPEQIHDAATYAGQAARVETVPEDRGWDGSIVALLQFPDVLRWLDQNPAWTDEMGQAVTYQQGDVLDAIQDYRRSVMDAGNLKSNQYQTVRAAPEQDIRIEPARPEVVYVPSYDPAVATQPQPPQQSPGINPWIIFGGGAVVGALGAWALYSIFDDDDDDDEVHHHYHGGGQRRIRRYDNYYYSRGRRPRPAEWTPRQRARARARAEGWERPRRLEHASPARPANRAALRPPRTRPPDAAPTPRELRQERREQKHTREQERQMQRREQRQQRQDRQRTQRSHRQPQRREQRPEGKGQPQQRERQQQEMRQQQRRQQKAERGKDGGQRKKKKKHQQQNQ
jgi:hypothetical protein